MAQPDFGKLPLNKKTWVICLFVITLLGGAIRFGALSCQSIWYDEAYVINITQTSSAWELFTGQKKDNGNPPLYFMLHGWMTKLTGTDEFGHRSLSALIGMSTIPLIALLGRRIHSSSVGLIASGLFAISPFQIEMSAEARVYTLVHLISVLCSWLLLRWLSSQKWIDGLAYALAMTVACYAHYYLIFLIGAHILTLMVQPNRVRIVGRWSVLMALVTLLWFPWLPSFLDQFLTPGNLGRMEGSWKTQFAATPVVFSVGRTFGWRDAGIPILALAVLISLIGFWLPAIVGISRLRKQQSTEYMLLSSWIVLPVLLPLLAALCGKPVYHHRYGSVALPAFLICVSLGIYVLPSRVKLVCVFIIAISTLYSDANYYRKPIKDDWRSATESMFTEQNPNDVYLTDSDIEVLPFLYYSQRSGTVPKQIYGLLLENDKESLTGVLYLNGTKVASKPEDFTLQITGSSQIHLGLCMPVKDQRQHREFFERNGYELIHQQEFYRIIVLTFRKRNN